MVMDKPTLITTLLAAFQLSAFGSLSISEFLAVNGSGEPDKDGDLSDWIEIHNSGADAIDLTGWYLTDDLDRLTKWKIPKGTVSADGYQIIHASGKDVSGLFNPEIHANFSLSGDGEYLALIETDGVTIAHEFGPEYPNQRRNVSYGMIGDGLEVGYFVQPMPGEANGTPSEGLIDGVKFSVKRGYYDEPITLELTSDTPDVLIRYTDNGAEPSLFTGKEFSGPITIDKTTTIRARAERSGYISSGLKTHTYLFVDDVILQDTMSTKVTEDPVYGPLMRGALLEHPAISLVTPDTDISKTSEDPTSVEMIFPDGSDGFQIDAGVKRVGGHSLNAYPKNNMRLYFRSEYGSEKLLFPSLYEDHPYTDLAAESFDQLNLRSGSHDSLFYLGASSSPQPPSDGQYLRNRWISDMQFIMGHESLRGRWVQVYVNGIYLGHYQILERNTQDHFANYLGGKKSDHVAINKGQGIGRSDMSAWTAMRDSRNDYEEFQRRVDVNNYVDYMLLNYYCGNDWDWNPEQNWGAGGPVEPDSGGIKFIAWDSDIIFRRLDDNNLGKGGPHSMFPVLMDNEEFAMLVSDRIQKHFFNDGLLTPVNVAKAYNFRAEQIRLSIVAETARWQSGRWTRDNQWQSELDRLNDDFFPNRTKEILKQFQSKGWMGVAAAPTMNQLGGYVESGFTVSLQKSSIFTRGTVIFTTSDIDPRQVGGEMSATASEYVSGFPISETTTVKARIMNSDGWSALAEARFVVDQTPANADNLTISKIHYRPTAATEAEVSAGYSSRKDFEFVELLNLGESTIDLLDVRFNKGIQFRFQEADITSIEPGGHLFVVKNPDAFRMRYGEGLPMVGAFSGSLSNDGDLLKIVNGADEVLQELRYNDAEPWPAGTDGDGRFLVLKNTEKALLDDAFQWRASEEGEPLNQTGPPPASELTYASWAASSFPAGFDSAPQSDPDADGSVNLLEFTFGSDPSSSQSKPLYTMTSSEEQQRFEFAIQQRSGIGGVTLLVESTDDLITWQEVTVEVTRQESLEVDLVTYHIPGDAAGGALFFRLRATLGAE